MKKILTLLCVLIINAVTLSAQQARFLIDEVDAFTQNHTLETNCYWLNKSTNFSNPLCYRIRIDDEGAMLVANMYRVTDFRDGEDITPRIHFLDADGNIQSYNGVNSDVRNRVFTSGVHLGYGIHVGAQTEKTDLELLFPIDKQCVEYLLDVQIQNIRVEVGENTFDYYLKKNQLKQLKKLLNLVLPKL